MLVYNEEILFREVGLKNFHSGNKSCHFFYFFARMFDFFPAAILFSWLELVRVHDFSPWWKNAGGGGGQFFFVKNLIYVCFYLLGLTSGDLN